MPLPLPLGYADPYNIVNGLDWMHGMCLRLGRMPDFRAVRVAYEESSAWQNVSGPC